MKRILVVFLAIVGLSSASAQSDLFIGGSLDIEVAGGTGIALDAQAGDYGLFDSFGARGTIGLGISPGIYIKLAGDALFPFSVDNDELTPYAGGGIGLLTGNGTSFNIHALGGAEYLVSEQIGLFGELAPGLYFGGGDTDFGIGLRFGANYHLN